jgi:16S rRNA (guanine527-N7)-methyltransferase
VNSREFRARLIERAGHAGVDIPTDASALLEQYFVLLRKWNETINLTALRLREPSDEALDRLLIEPLGAAPLIDNRPAPWFDLGSGGGSPAIPLKIVRPRLQLTMVESRSRKAAFLHEAIRVLALEDAAVETVRFERLVDETGRANSAQLVTVRAVKIDGELLDTSRRLLAPGGMLILFGSPERLSGPEGFEPTRKAGVYRRCST